ncbi:MAG: patatin-like phospholipase family protein [Chloroflexota bacterium]
MVKRKRVGLVLGAGGITGGAWLAGTLSEIAAVTGWEPGTADLIVGTSAGSVMAALIASGLSARRLMPTNDDAASEWPLHDLTQRESYAAGRGRQLPSPGSVGLLLAAITYGGSAWNRGTRILGALAPRGRIPTDAIHEVVRRAMPNGWADHPACWIVATEYGSGRRVVFGRDRCADLATAVAASCAIPGFFNPVRIGDREYVDGGVMSPTNADLAGSAGVDIVICLNPLARRPIQRSFHPAAHLEALIRDSACRQFDKEVAGLKGMGIEVHLIEPGSDELAVVGFDPMDPTHCLEIATRAANHARRRLRRLPIAKALQHQVA